MKNQTILLFVALLMLFTFSYAQKEKEPFKFDKKYYQAYNNWVVLPKKATDSTYTFGFIYLDRTAGFTFQVYPKIKVKSNKLYLLKDTVINRLTAVKHRLDGRYKSVNWAILTDPQISDLGLPKQPDWLSIYYKGKEDVSFLKAMGYQLNHIGLSKEAIPYLLKVFKINSKHEGVYFELAYAYNATGKFKDAENVLKEAIKFDKNNILFYKELMYAQMKIKNISDAEKTTLKGFKIKGSDAIKAEMAFNLTANFYNNKKNDKFKKWLAFMKQYDAKDQKFKQYVAAFEKEKAKLVN